MLRTAPDLAAITGRTAECARDLLEADGWRVVGQGDWATALADRGGTWCVRLVPFDPAFLLFAQDVLAGPRNRWLPHVEAVVPLAGDGYAVLMERLWPADPESAARFCAAAESPADGEDTDLAALRARLGRLDAEGATRFPHLWGGTDVRQANVLADAEGRPRLIDPLYLSGPRVIDALAAGDTERLADLTRPQLEAFLTIAAFRRDGEDGAAELRRHLNRLP